MRMFLHLIGVLAVSVFAMPANASQADRLADVLRIDEVIDVMLDEGQAFGAELDRDMLDGQGGAFWAAQIARVYNRDVMESAVRKALNSSLTDSDIEQSLAFYDSDLGHRILTLETTARQAMSDKTVEDIARATYEDLSREGDARYMEIVRFVDANDLLERNVTGALNATYHFMRGLSEGGAGSKSDTEMTADIWSQEEETRADIRGWLFGYLLMAFGPLDDDELAAYIEFSQTDAGQALNAALFDGFDATYLDISHALGLLVARALETDDL